MIMGRKKHSGRVCCTRKEQEKSPLMTFNMALQMSKLVSI